MLCPSIPGLKLQALGNVLWHQYDGVEGDRVWFRVEDELPLLKMGAGAALKVLIERDGRRS